MADVPLLRAVSHSHHSQDGEISGLHPAVCRRVALKSRAFPATRPLGRPRMATFPMVD